MDALNSLGLFIVIIMFLLGTAGTLLCAGYGAWMLKKQWESGFDWVSPPTAKERQKVDEMDAVLRQRAAAEHGDPLDEMISRGLGSRR